MGQWDYYNKALQLICKAQLKSMRAQYTDILTNAQTYLILNKDPLMLQNQLQSGPTAYKVVNKTNHINPMHFNKPKPTHFNKPIRLSANNKQSEKGYNSGPRAKQTSP
jgi:hypothetical protein